MPAKKHKRWSSQTLVGLQHLRLCSPECYPTTVITSKVHFWHYTLFDYYFQNNYTIYTNNNVPIM